MSKPNFHSIRQEILSRLFISEIAKDYGLNPKGNAKSCLCPWHKDRKPSLGFDDQLGRFKCFAAGCGRSGSIFDLVMVFEEISYWEALCKLAEKAGVVLSATSKLKKKWGAQQKKLELNKKLTDWLKKNLRSSKGAMSYLEERGYKIDLVQRLSETINLGYLPKKGLYKLLQGIANKTQADYISQRLSPLSGRLIAPWCNTYGEVVGWWGRSTNGREPKYLYSKGTKKSTPYLLHLAKRTSTKSVLCIVEGMFDAAIAQALDWQEIVATGQAAVPGKTQLEQIKEAGFGVVVLIPDADEQGKKALVKAKSRLLKNAKSAGVEILIGEISGKYKDLDASLTHVQGPLAFMEEIVKKAQDLPSWLEGHYTGLVKKASTPLETALARVEKADNVLPPERIPLKSLGIKDNGELLAPLGGWKVPEGWMVKDDGIYQVQITGEGREKIKKIAHTPFVLSARSVNIDSGKEQLEVAFPRDKVLRRIWMSRKELLNRNSIIELSEQGFPVTSSKAKIIIDYVEDFEATNLSLIPRMLTVSSFGWKYYEGERFFVLGENTIGTDMKIHFLPEGEGERNFARAFTAHGSFKKWKKTIKKALQYPKVAFGIYYSFTPPLLPILQVQSSILSFCNESSSGKSSALMVAASIWGDPVGERGGITPTWNATPVSLERLASLFKALPLFLDDAHLASPFQIKNMIYMLAGGVGKLRGALRGSQKTDAWNLNTISTTESPLTASTKYEGAKARIIELYGFPFDDASGSIVRNMKTTVGNHYGHAGPRFLEKLIPYLATHKKHIQESFGKKLSLLRQMAKTGVDDRRTSYFAATWMTASLVEEFLELGGEPDKVIPTLFEELCQGERDFAEKAMESISSWVMANWNNFEGNNQVMKGEVFGVIRTGEYVAIFPHKLKDYLQKEGYSYEAVLRGFRERGWIQTDRRNMAVKVGYRGGFTRMIKLFWNNIML